MGGQCVPCVSRAVAVEIGSSLKEGTVSLVLSWGRLQAVGP